MQIPVDKRLIKVYYSAITLIGIYQLDEFF